MSTAELPVDAPVVMFGTAGRYANALYAAAAKKGTLLDVEADLKLFKEAVEVSPVLKNFVIDPSISRAKKAAGITSLMESAKASETTTNAMVAIAEGGRSEHRRARTPQAGRPVPGSTRLPRRARSARGRTSRPTLARSETRGTLNGT